MRVNPPGQEFSLVDNRLLNGPANPHSDFPTYSGDVSDTAPPHTRISRGMVNDLTPPVLPMIGDRSTRDTRRLESINKYDIIAGATSPVYPCQDHSSHLANPASHL